MHTLNISFLVPLLFCIGISACGGNKKENNQKAETETIDVAAELSAIEPEDKTYPIATPIKFAQMVSETVTDFNDSLTNLADNTKKYRNGFTRSLNLGIYASDLCFVSIFNKQEAIMEYSSVLTILSDEMHLTGCFDHTVLDRINEFQDKPDSLSSCIKTSILDIYRFMNKNDQAEMAIVFLAGTWIEGFYITTQLYKNTPLDEKRLKILAEFKRSLQVLLELFELNHQNVGIKALHKDFEEIHKTFAEIKDLGVASNTFKSLTDTIASIRSKCIN